MSTVDSTTRSSTGQFFRPTFPQIDGVCFKEVSGFLGYIVGDDGTVWSLGQSRGLEYRQLKPGKRNPKYHEGDRPSVYLRRNGKSHPRLVGALVLEAFIGPRPEDGEVCHFPDSDTANNRLINLRWDTHAGNINDKRINGTTSAGIRNPKAKLTAEAVLVIRRRSSEGVRTRHLSVEFGVSASTIQRIVSGKLWSNIGYDAAVLAQRVREGAE